MKFQKPRKPTNVLKFPKRSGKSRQIPKQACSYCKKKAPALSFYSDQGNKVIGVCRECKPQAERLGLLRL
ncbi:hypothetical protein [Paenibacillus eucommiae]|uniref:50S ribosomal protein L34e n=1 Tax=Paenibacillus eucommiae TaxID=1355755 RepID=A0ABS4IYR0_9BACL|nr:hypothetical protein [Paenibacillus eucommiae]MBP1992718.1 hypothetical protein [Paenibacillus eucommiae]